ncbi:MAG: NAD(P)/FAD-dependent oxidoreductase, partial [Rhizobiaceae bacterium]
MKQIEKISATACKSRRAGAVGHINSYYADTAPTLSYFPPMDADQACEVCVIGGGLAGLTTACELGRAGIETILLESNRLAWAASGRNGGFVAPGFARSIFEIEKKLGLDHAQQLYRLSAEGVAYVRGVIRKAGAERIIGGTGWLSMVRHSGAHSLEHQAERMVRDYNAVQTYLSRSELQKHVSSKKYHAGVMDMGCFHIQPLEYAGVLASQARKHGVSIFENSRASSISRNGNKWKIVVGNKTVTAGKIVLATSVYGGPAERLNGALVPVTTYIVAAKSRGRKIKDSIRFTGCLSDFRRANDYYRIVGPDDGPTIIWGGRITTRQTQPSKLADKLMVDIRLVYPQLDDLETTHAWSGLMAYPVYKMPIIAKLDDTLWAATGFGGHGLNTTAMAG